jgi:hypothetical protein
MELKNSLPCSQESHHTAARTNAHHRILFCFFKIHFNIILGLVSRQSTSGFENELPIRASRFASSMLFGLIIPNTIFCEHYKFIKVFRCPLIHPPLISRILAPDILLGNFFATVPFLFPQIFAL